MIRLVSLVALAAFSLASLASAQAGFEDRVRFRVVARGDGANLRGRTTLDAGDPATLANGWARLGLRGSIPQPIQWATERVLIIALGQRATGGYGIQLQDVRRDMGGVATVYVRETTPPKGAIVTQAVTSPYIVLAVDRLQVNSFRFVWSAGPYGNLAGVPDGSVILPGANGYTVVYPPLVGDCDFFGGDYWSYRSDPGQVWIESPDDLAGWGQLYFRDPGFVRPGFDFSSERLLAVHLGARPAPTTISVVSFAADPATPGAAILTLREGPARNLNSAGRPISPYGLFRVRRDVRSVKVVWAKDGR